MNYYGPSVHFIRICRFTEDRTYEGSANQLLKIKNLHEGK